MKITREQLKKIIMEEIATEDVEEVDDEIVITDPEGRYSDFARGSARVEDVIQYLMAQEREDLAEPLRKVQQLLDIADMLS